MTNTIDPLANNAASIDDQPGWKLAGAAWSHAATDWAYGFEPYARDAIEKVFELTGVGPGTTLLDVACGAGLAIGRAQRIGARSSGLDAAAGLLEIAARRAPRAELVQGDMFQLPWQDDAFDVVVSFNGIWGGCEDATAEMARVCRPGGRLGVTFWGSADQLDLLGYFMTVGAAGPGVAEEIEALATISALGVAEEMLARAGCVGIERGVTSAILEFPDADAAWRTLRSPGLVVPAIEFTGEQALRERVLDSIEPFRQHDGSYRLVNELVHVVAELA